MIDKRRWARYIDVARGPRAKEDAMFDFDFSNHGSICLLTPRTEEALCWVDEFLPEDVMRWGEYSIVIEHRYVDPILQGIEDEGLTVEII